MSDFVQPTPLDDFLSKAVPAVDKTRCAVCDTPESENVKLLRCSRCRKVAYCSRDCQKADWKATHKAKCDVLLTNNAINSTSTTFGVKGAKRKTGARTKGEILQDLSAYAAEHNGEAFTVAAWMALDLISNIARADTHVLAITLRRNTAILSPAKKLYSFVDADVVPISIWDRKFENLGAVDTRSGLKVIPSVILKHHKAEQVRGGGLGATLVTTIELGPDEEKPVERALLETTVPMFQPLGLFKAHKDTLSRLPGPVPVSLWKQSLKNACNGGAFAPMFQSTSIDALD